MQIKKTEQIWWEGLQKKIFGQGNDEPGNR